MRRLAPIFVLACVALVLFFHQEESPNPLSRLLTPYALVEHHTLQADQWRDAYDKAVVDGHVYSDKAPLSSFLVLPFYAGMRLFESGPQSQSDRIAAVHIGDVVGAAIPFAIFALLLLRRARREGMSPELSVAIALGATFGTFLFNYGGAFFGHMLAATFLIGGWALATEDKHLRLAGFLGGCSVLTEYPLVLLQAAIVIALWFEPDRMRKVRDYVIGAAPCAVLLFVWNFCVTGNPLDFPFSHVPDLFRPMQHHFGIALPDLGAAWELTFSQFRGAFFYAPALLLFLPLMTYAFAGPNSRRNVVLLAAAGYLLFVSSYFQWDGGWCTGPRHLLPPVALLLYEGVGALAKNPRFLKPFAALSALGLAVNLLAVSTNPCPNDQAKLPVFQIFWPRLVDGKTADAILVDMGAPRGAYLVVIWLVLFVAGAIRLAFAARKLLATEKT